jgi:hypothetical protein
MNIMEKVFVWMFAFVFLMTGVFAAEGDGKIYTNDFYIFLGLLVLLVIIIGIFVWLWIRGPVNKWK